jgi:hypothetical protein
MPSGDALKREELERLELFASADLAALEPALRSCTIRNLASGEVLIAAGKPNAQLYLVLAGQLSVHRRWSRTSRARKTAR